MKKLELARFINKNFSKSGQFVKKLDPLSHTKNIVPHTRPRDYKRNLHFVLLGVVCSRKEFSAVRKAGPSEFLQALMRGRQRLNHAGFIQADADGITHHGGL